MLAVDLTPAEAAVKLAALAGLELTDSQRAELAGMCELGPDERWLRTEFRLGYTGPDHGPILTARALAGLFLFGERRIVWCTDDEVDTYRALQDFAAVLEGYEPMRAQIATVAAHNGGQRIELKDGHRIMFDTCSGRRWTRRFRGVSVDTIILDGMAPIDSDEWNLLVRCSMATARRPQLVHALVTRGG